jgi:formate hydrogenlyase subunit 3/multisubunit Na+/H+ antiporter MnhD subunit
MLVASLVLPPALLAAAAVVSLGLARWGVAGSRWLCAAAAWLALLALFGGWFGGGRTPLDISTTAPLTVTRLALHLDAVVVVFGGALLLPVSLLLTFQPRGWGESALATLTAAVALATLVAGSATLTALGFATCAGLVLVVLRREEVARTGHYWLALTGAWLLLAWTAILLEVGTGTSLYEAIPVTALGVPVFATLALACVLCAGLLPWRTWVSEAWTRRRLEAGALAVALLVPLGIYPLVRAYGMSAGQWPGGQLHLVLGGLGAATALGASIRAQAASSRRGFLAETVPLGAGLVLLALSLSTPLGLTAALTGILVLGLAAGLVPLVPDQPGTLSGLAVGLVLGVPPAIGFGAWLLIVQSTLASGRTTAFLGLAGAAAWLLALAAAARSSRLPARPAGTMGGGSWWGTLAGVAIALAGGIGLTATIAFVAVPAAAEVMPAASPAAQPAVSIAAVLAPGSLTVSTAVGGWAAALLAGPLVLVGLVAAAALGLLRRNGSDPQPMTTDRVLELSAPTPPFFPPPLAGLPERCVEVASGIRLPAQYRSLLQPAALELAAGRARPWFWVVATAVLAVAVTR